MKHKKAFTLVELVVVIGIIAVLAAVITPQILVLTAKSRDARRLADCHTYVTILQNYLEVKGHFPGATGDPNNPINSLNCEIGNTDDPNFANFKAELGEFTNFVFAQDPLYDDAVAANQFYYFYDGNRNNFVEPAPQTPGLAFVSIHVQNLEIKNGNINSYPDTPDAEGGGDTAEFILALQDPKTP